MMQMNEFHECEACAQKIGHPILCEACLRNRATIHALKEIEAQKDAQIAALVEALRKARDKAAEGYCPPTYRILEAALAAHKKAMGE